MGKEDRNNIYKKAGYATEPMGWGNKPALLVVDFQKGFTYAEALAGGDMTAEVEKTAILMEEARKKNIKIFLSYVGYRNDWADLGTWVAKSAALNQYTREDNWYCEMDERLGIKEQDIVFEKHAASCFSGTNLINMLIPMQIDTLIVAGCVTAGCVYATVAEAMGYGYRVILAEDCITDRSKETHDMFMWNMGQKYGDKMDSGDVIKKIQGFNKLEYAFMNPETEKKYYK